MTYTIGGIISLLHYLGFSYKKSKGVPGKMDARQQQKFINQYNGVKARGPVYFGDSTHPTLNPILSSGWIKEESGEKYLYLVLDNAPYNRSKRVRDLAGELGLKILYLPPYSPNLNPIERLWKFMKKRVLSNRYFEDLETFRKELMLFMRGIRKYKDELSTLITDNFQVMET